MGKQRSERSHCKCVGDPLRLLRGQFIAGLWSAVADRRAGGFELSASALRECVHADLREHLVCLSELLACVDAPGLTAKPLAIEKMGAGQFRQDAAAA